MYESEVDFVNSFLVKIDNSREIQSADLNPDSDDKLERFIAKNFGAWKLKAFEAKRWLFARRFVPMLPSEALEPKLSMKSVFQRNPEQQIIESTDELKLGDEIIKNIRGRQVDVNGTIKSDFKYIRHDATQDGYYDISLTKEEVQKHGGLYVNCYIYEDNITQWKLPDGAQFIPFYDYVAAIATKSIIEFLENTTSDQNMLKTIEYYKEIAMESDSKIHAMDMIIRQR